jgi:hypothetical protein
MITISRPVNGITLNGDEYLLDDTGEAMLFESVEDAKEHLLSKGLEAEDIENFNFNEEKL